MNYWTLCLNLYYIVQLIPSELVASKQNHGLYDGAQLWQTNIQSALDITLFRKLMDNQGVLIMSGQHAREWIAITSALFILREIVTKFDHQKNFICNKDWYIVPLLNPDGYVYSYRHDRFWRKNRRYTKDCYGVDLNRNFGFHFDVPGITEHNQCQEIYSGPFAFSEPETIALRNVVLKLQCRLSGMLDLHSFGQLILFPWGAKAQTTSDQKNHNFMASEMSKAIMNFKKRTYTYGQTYHHIYPASGSFVDWIYSIGVRHSYAIEGRDRGTKGILIPPECIQESGHEMLSAVRRFVSLLDKEEPEQFGRKIIQNWF